MGFEMISTVWGSTDKPIASERLAELLSSEQAWEGTLYVGYPIIGTPDGSFPIDAMLALPDKGLVLFHIVEGRTPEDFAAVQDDSYNKMSAKLLQHPSLVRGRQLGVRIHTVTFAPAIPGAGDMSTDDHPVTTATTVLAAVAGLPGSDPALFPSLLAVVQAISSLRRGRRRREAKRPDSRGTKLKGLEDSIANLDSQQSAAVIETFDGVQRIRGLAGSGKTIVLALKVAYLHARHPDWLIAVTFATRSLHRQFVQLITTFVMEQTNEEPDWERVRILNAWGASGGGERTGIYFEYCRDHGVPYMDFGSAKTFGRDREFEGVVDLALRETKQFVRKYDAILVDEAQDFAPNFLELCYEYLKDPKRLVYAYDELQNLGKRSLPPMEEIFGKDAAGKPRVTLRTDEPGKPKQDIILDVCYRNSRPILSTAHALGFGVYRTAGLVQIFENKELWLDIGYALEEGTMADDVQVRLARTAKSSPQFLEVHSPPEDLIQFHVFEDDQAQRDWLVQAIQQNLGGDELLPDDIVVINPDPIKTRDAVRGARQALLRNNINSNLAGVTTDPNVFSEPGSVTFTGVFRAKGNEAAMVYVINAQDCFAAFLPGDLARARNRLFTAMTRSKAWVRVLGVGPSMRGLMEEYERAKAENYTLSFVYPGEAQRAKMTIVNRDMSSNEKAKVTKRKADLQDIVESLVAGETYLQDYPEEMVAKLRALLNEDG